MAVINTNSLSLLTQNNLNKSQSSLGTAIERLSSGLRINSAKDDAAGQAIANRFTSNIKGLTQAARNANDGISIAQTTEGSLNEINNNLQRVRELTVQATTGSNSSSDLDSIQDEIGLRLAEIDRVSAQTQFNGTKVLSENTTMNIQVGANDGETIAIKLQKIDSQSLGLGSYSVSGVSGALTSLTDTSVDGVTTSTALDIKGLEAVAGKGATVHGVGEVATDKKGTYSDYVIRTNDGKQYQGAVDANGKVTFADTTLKTAAATAATSAAAAAAAPTDTDLAATAKTDADAFTTALTAAKQYTPVGAATASPLETLDAAIKQVDGFRSQLGAVQNRFESAVTNLNNTVNNLTSARSRIEDADYATEVSNMSRAQILQQAGTSVLSQANQVPQTVLSLLR
ncbi:FliC/FljB family flagellin [Yersinia kristensenii]|uniref:FliC/FljB family flagellin n=1 Tax=Yersinia kristensenii TaxID=28152 RepID=UPI000C149B09|nr:FliC/FljB family flagellin [Yersinia kristensenii]MDA5522654.1 FliC/FljB family flagellin [Yersinia kristensenii]MDR4897795.1 FliC/FljB family flagellin [Yersinia kristensenii]MDX6735102.1 FliC/FljB family flagellin [Yersinia kristensenii]PHZ34623.1 flagellin FliC [Yersinia kristensenii]